MAGCKKVRCWGVSNTVYEREKLAYFIKRWHGAVNVFSGMPNGLYYP
jgi:hypothetical protein